MSKAHATNYTRLTIGASAQAINNGEPIIVHAIIAASLDDALFDIPPFQITDKDDNPISYMYASAFVNGGSVIIDTPFIAYNGLKIGTSATGFITVLWRPTG